MTHQVETPSPGEPSGETPGEPVAAGVIGGGEPSTPETAVPAGSSSGGLWSFVREIAIVLVVALGLSFLIKLFLIQAFFIPSESMEQTLVKNDRVIVSKLTPGPFDLHRGDIVVFRDPAHWLRPEPKPKRGPIESALVNGLTFIGLLPSDSGEHLIKRVIGLPGDTVQCCDAQGRLLVNGVPIDETEYLYPGVDPSGQEFTVTVPEGRLWVMGDNRPNSADSRAHRDNGQDGTVPLENVVGRAFVLVWPADRFRWLTNPADVFENVPAPAH